MAHTGRERESTRAFTRSHQVRLLKGTMSLALHDLLTCCRRLENERATERRNEIENFKRLLRDPETVLQLDRNSDSRRGNQLNWDAVFSVLKKYFQKEMENLRLAKPNASASTQTTKQKRMQEIGSLVKYFIRCANRSE
ncbi:serine-protein kinase ATM-like isoform X2 [Numida meleagris]|uniref:serine-protein kinase ATM-like isoform X2 n=1 Tax=Numida meleagris TaxID=8996 RepID=UPI000B3DC2E3|nr:serine-protein kinase ATM-like isoform X2 [Numida meleagris]